MDAVENVLAHYGVLGQKWGVRTKRPKAGSGPSGPTSPDHKQAQDIIKKINKHGIGSASNSDLQMLQKRIALQTKYNEMYPKKQHLAVKGAKIAKKLLLPIAERELKSFIEKQVGLKLNPPEIPELGKHSPGYGRHKKR